MVKHDFIIWCSRAVRGIRYKPDRDAVSNELFGHLEDRYNSFLEQGIPAKEAILKALEAMGDPDEIAPLLAAIHRPFWGYLQSITKWIFRIMCVVVFFPMLSFLWSNQIPSRDEALWDPYTHTSYYNEYTGKTSYRTGFWEPKASDSSDGYTFTVTRASEWPDDGSFHSDRFYFEIEVFNPRPWAKHTDICRRFQAVDSLGNFYYSAYEALSADSRVTGNYHRSGFFTYTHTMWLRDYRSYDAEWIDLYYDRSGRDIVLRIDLTEED